MTQIDIDASNFICIKLYKYELTHSRTIHQYTHSDLLPSLYILNHAVAQALKYNISIMFKILS